MTPKPNKRALLISFYISDVYSCSEASIPTGQKIMDCIVRESIQEMIYSGSERPKNAIESVRHLIRDVHCLLAKTITEI